MAHLVESLVKSFTTVKEMLVDRGVDVSNLAHISDTELQTLASENNIFDMEVTPTMKIVFCLLSKFKIVEIRDLVANFQESTPKNLIIVTRELPTPATIKLYTDEFPEIDTQFFSIKELQFNIAKHSLVPKHELIHDQDAIQQIMGAYLVKSKAQFPIILKTDPMARYINAKSGDLVKITRASPSSGEYISYRCCV